MFDFQEIYNEGDSKILEINILPENYCNFDCVFCPIGGATLKQDQQLALGDIHQSYEELFKIIDENKVDLVYFNSNGESFIHEKFEEMVEQLKLRGLKVRLFSNGYMLGMPEYMGVAIKCDEVFGEIKCTTDQGFQRYQRPVSGYSLDRYISNMADFRSKYQGKFTIVGTILKGVNDNEESITWIKAALNKIHPDEILVDTLTDDKLGMAFGIDEERLSQISHEIMI